MKKIYFLVLVIFVGCGGAAGLWFPIPPLPYVEEEEYVVRETPVIRYYNNYEPISGIETIVPEVPQRRAMVALTFDDGPSTHTSSILDLLEEYNARATFFLLGDRVRSRPNTVRRIYALGNEIGNHSWSHTRFTEITFDEIVRELEMTGTAISELVDYQPILARPPFGSTNQVVKDAFAEAGYAVIMWSLDTLDWKYRDSDWIYNIIMDEVRDGSIILLHDLHAQTAVAMERVIPSLIEADFDLVTVSELLAYFYGELVPGKIYDRIDE
ncbi:MAG: polysaccharide deacetylase family protein [Turicibacter sp.]|nr:polysaccharide deacetylase family protein [Turicibacter sp.]